MRKKKALIIPYLFTENSIKNWNITVTLWQWFHHVLLAAHEADCIIFTWQRCSPTLY